MLEPKMKAMAVMDCLLTLLSACLETNRGVLMDDLKAQSSARPVQIFAALDTMTNRILASV